MASVPFATLQPIATTPEVQRAAAAMEATATALDAAQKQFLAIRAIVDPHVAREGSVSRVEYWQARAAEAAGAQAVSRLEVAAVEARRVFDDAYAAERARQLRVLHDRKRQVVTRFAAALHTAAEINGEVIALEEAERAVCGGSIADVLAWIELAPSSATFDAKLDCWLRAVRTYGLLE